MVVVITIHALTMQEYKLGLKDHQLNLAIHAS